jgi:UDP-glucuronate decarboxylase
LGAARRTVLVTGAAGFIGSHLVDRLLASGFEVIGLDNLMTGNLANLQRAARDPHFHLEIGDVRETLHVYAQTIFNLACPASPVHYQSDPHATFTTSVLGAMRVVEHARSRKCRIIHASTSEVYGDPLEHPQKEEYSGNVNPIGPRACYDEGKRAAETMLMDARRLKEADIRIVRIFNTYGPRMALNDGRVVSTFIDQCLQGKPITVFGDGNQTRSFCYVSDLVEGLISAARVEDLDGPVNIGNPEECKLLDLAALVMDLCGRRVDVVHRPLPQDDPRRRCPDITRARRLLGFEPEVSLRDGLLSTIPDFRNRLDSARE